MSEIGTKSVKELRGMRFFIPNYQRGYRWSEQQVTDLLNDINEFRNRGTGFYCIQPLVVTAKKGENILQRIKDKVNEDVDDENTVLESIEALLKEMRAWEVIDGQQRLTTIYLILKYLGEGSFYSIEYGTRKGFDEFLDIVAKKDGGNISFGDFLSGLEDDKKRAYDNIDFYHIFNNFKVIDEWFEEDATGEKRILFKETLLNHVKFIWYESVDEDPIKVFTRLNIGKIPLTNAELIKALFLNSANLREENAERLHLRQREIANEWDNIEYTLQNEEFWLFLHQKGYEKPTRIDFIFELLVENDTSLDKNRAGNDEYRTFRYFSEKILQDGGEERVKICWDEVKKVFQTFQEWFNDLEMYHYAGFLIEQGVGIKKIYDCWKNDKNDFLKKLKSEIKNKISNCCDLDLQYELEGNPEKKVCKPLLLLHNIQTVINQNSKLKENEKYALPVFYKFPFHLYKLEKWDVEHIDSNTTNTLESEKEQKEWLKYSLFDINVSKDEDLRLRIEKFINGNCEEVNFEELSRSIEESIGKESGWDNQVDDKNKVWNFVLLDAGTNRGYGNAIFPAKRRTIIGKDQGKRIEIDDNLQEKENEGEIAFVPVVTKNVFLKYYNTSVDNLRTWTKSDAVAYKKNIYDILKDFGVVYNVIQGNE